MTLTIQPQTYPTHTGDLPLSYGIFAETEEGVIFLAYSWSEEGAEEAIKLIQECCE